MASGTAENNVPQWKRDLIQRRRQQNKQPGNGVKLTTAFENNNSHPNQCTEASRSRLSDSNATAVQVETVSRGSAGGATASHSILAAGVGPVACNMRLEADASLCLSSEDPPKIAGRTHFEKEDCRSFGGRNKVSSRHDDKDTDSHCVFAEFRKSRTDNTNGKRMDNNNGKIGEECESDSSEELQYGPGIVNRLKSKYLNLTLREVNKPRTSVQRFRRAASLEDLLDCEDDGDKGCARKFTKKTAAITGVAAKTDRYRNATRGNESMKRARSVETLMRYQCPIEDGKYNAMVRQEPVNDHIVLIDRTAVKIESRLMEERPKALNKPKRLKPLLAETERPPADLVKTTLRIFEGSVKKLKPKGDVAAKVATFKTINDTYKAQTMKKVIPKPPIQPKPFINGSAKITGSPKKIILPTKSTAEIIERTADVHSDEYKNDGVVTELIVQSVSSVVSKFQQIEKSHSPSPSPEPTVNKLKFSPASSPEPSLNKFKDYTAKSPPLIISSPLSPKKDISRQHLTSVSPMESPTKEDSTLECEKLSSSTLSHDDIEQIEIETQPTISISIDEVKFTMEVELDNQSDDIIVEGINEETVDGLRTISKAALDNISKAGSTFQFRFENDSTSIKTYLPGAIQNGQSRKVKSTNAVEQVSSIINSTNSSTLPDVDTMSEVVNNSNHKRMDVEKEMENRDQIIVTTLQEKKAIGAISSLGLIKSTTTTTSYSTGNDCKSLKCQKTEISPPQKQIGIIRPLVSTKTQMPQQNLSNRELEKNLINRVKSIEQPTKVVVSLKASVEEIQPVKKCGAASAGGLWDTKPWNQQNNTMVFNFSNRKDVPDYIENDGLIIRRKREKPKVGDGGIIVLDATLDASTTDDSDWEISGGPPSPCDVSFMNDNILINGRSNLSRSPRNHKHRIQFDDTATKTFEYPSEASILEDEGTSVDGEISASASEQPLSTIANKSVSPNPILGGGGLASYTPSKVDLTSETFELGVTRTLTSTPQPTAASEQPAEDMKQNECAESAEDTAAWGVEATADLLY